MKRVFAILSIFVMTWLMVVGAAATSLSDSLRIGKTTYEILGGVEGDTVIRLYHGKFMGGFAAGESISALTGEDYVTKQVYMTRSRRGRKTYRTISDGRLEETDEVSLDGDCIYNIVKNPGRVFSGKITIDNIWCLDGDSDERGIYIYFATDKGDYVYYRESADTDAEYLLPYEKFTEFARAVVNGPEGGADAAYDLSPFLIKEEIDFFLIAAAVIAVAGTLALCGCTVLLRR